jgi:two-component system, OmpR family, sensor histidine kinase VicK
MRWWLAAAFVMIAALTATLVAAVSSRQADRAVQASSEDVAVGKTVSAAFAIEHALQHGDLARPVATAAARRDLALFVFGPDGRLLSDARSHGILWRSVPERTTALAVALHGHRYVRTSGEGGATVTALPLRRTEAAAAIVAYAPRPLAYGKSLAIFRREVFRGALWAIAAAAGVGVFAAGLIARRLRRIAAAAAAIERGDFAAPLRAGFGDEVGALAATIDRMRRRLQVSFEQVSDERDRLARLLEQLQEGVVAVGEDGVVQFANTRATGWLGRSVLAPGRQIPELWAGIPLLELARGLFRTDAVVAEARAVTPDERTVAVAGVPAGASDLAVIVLADITEQERRERREREFVASASHELRTPVSAIVTAVEALQSGAKDDPGDRDAFIGLIERQASRLGRLTRSLLLLARAQSHQETLSIENVALRPLLEQVAAITWETGDRIQIACAPDLVALVNRDVIEQVIANLLENALKHSDHAPVWLRARPEGSSAVIEIADDGPGIPIAAQDRVFERFYSGHGGRRDGFGLGLAIVRDAVRSLGGTIEVDSQPGRGTTMRVTVAAGRSS